MKYIDFIEQTKGMKPSEKSEFFHSLGVEGQTELMDSFSIPVTEEYMLLQVRLLQAASMIENEPDEEKRKQYLRVYDAIEEELDREKKKMWG